MSFSETFMNGVKSVKSVNMSSCTHNFGMRCIRILLMLVNIMFLILGILLISVGTTVHAVYNDVQLLLGIQWFSPALMLTVLGILILIVTAFGCLGTFKNSTCMINTFGAMLLGLFVLEVIAAVSSFAMSGTVDGVVSRSLRAAFREYPNGTEMQRERVDFLQQEMSCCGINSPNDWSKLFNNRTLPDSCCSYYDRYSDYNNHYGATVAPGNSEIARCVPYSYGCLHALHNLINNCAVILAAGTVAVCIIQVLGVTFAFQLAKAIRHAKTREDMERWEVLRQEQEPLPQTQLEQDRIEYRENETKIPQ